MSTGWILAGIVGFLILDDLVGKGFQTRDERILTLEAQLEAERWKASHTVSHPTLTLIKSSVSKQSWAMIDDSLFPRGEAGLHRCCDWQGSRPREFVSIIASDGFGQWRELLRWISSDESIEIRGRRLLNGQSFLAFSA